MGAASDQTARAGDGLPEVPGYRIERQVGRGSMGTVYLAEDVQLKRKVALKILTAALADDELFRKRFDRESQSAANLDHPNIVPVYAAGEAAGVLYIAMRYVSGGDLRAVLADVGTLSLDEAAAMVGSVGEALDAAHADGMIHRDVKPANVLVDDRSERGRYYLSDFGIAKMVSTGRSLTSAGQIVGTIDYIAPEQIQGKPVDGRSDLYALGCVLYQCLTGQVPFPREDTAALMWAHVNDGPPSVTAVRADLPSGIDRILARALAKDPDDRYPTGEALTADLRALAADPETPLAAAAAEAPLADPEVVAAGADPEAGTSTYTPPAALRTAGPEPAPAQAPASRRKLLLAIGAAAAFVLLVGSATAGVGYLGSRYPNDAEEALLRDVPLALQSTCTRNDDIVEGSANVEASLVCTPSGGEVNSFVFTKFSSPIALNKNYQAAVSTAGVSAGSGDCRSGDRAETGYRSETEQSYGRMLCFHRRGSSFLTWTDEQNNTLGVAIRHDPDNEKLHDWWAGVNDVTLPESDPAQAQPVPAPAPVVVAAAAPPTDVDPGVFGPELDMPAFRPGPSGEDNGSAAGGSPDGGEDTASVADGSSDERSSDQDKDDTPAAEPVAPPTEEGAKPNQVEPEQAEPGPPNQNEDAWMQTIRGNEMLRRAAEKRCDGAEKDPDGRIKDDKLATQCAKFDEKYRK